MNVNLKAGQKAPDRGSPVRAQAPYLDPSAGVKASCRVCPVGFFGGREVDQAVADGHPGD
jgi:hypothetical protein